MDEKRKHFLNIKYCCDPYKGHKKLIKKNLRLISEDLIREYPKLKNFKDQKICDNCRKKIADDDSSSSQNTNPSLSEERMEIEPITEQEESQEALTELNKSLIAIGESPVKKFKMDVVKKYSSDKMNKIQKSISSKLRTVGSATKYPLPLDQDPESSRTESSKDGEEMINQLKEKFQTTSKRSEQLQILTVLPKSWSLSKIKSEFNVTNYMARQAKKLAMEEGIMSLPSKRKGTFPSETIKVVEDFYKNEEVSRIMPGKKDFKSVRKDGQKTHEQKYLILGNLKEIYHLFKTKYPDTKIGFSKFAELRPNECVLAGGAGTHSVCVCTHHQNVKLMIIGTRLPQLTKDSDLHLDDYKTCLSFITCDPPTYECYFDECSECFSKIDELKLYVTKILDDNMIDEVNYKQWLSTDRSTLELVSRTTEEFIDTFTLSLLNLKKHDFIAKKQAQFCSTKKEELKDGEILVVCDFAENYSFLLQDAAQGYHWNNSQATLHPFLSYYKEAGETQHISFVVISNCLKHDTVAVHLFKKKLIEFFKKELKFPITKIIYFSDGAASQYKNFKNFINLCHHKSDFGLEAEWHFFATSHGKGPCDGVGGTVKRLAAKASLQRAYNDQIMTPQQLFDFAERHIKGIKFSYVPNSEYIEEKNYLQERFDQASAIIGTQKLHSFEPVNENELRVKTISSASEFKKVKISYTEAILLEDVKGFVTAKYDDKWYLGCVLDTNVEKMTVKITFLEPEGPSNSFKYPRKPDVLVLPLDDILSIVEPVTATGRTYKLSKNEQLKSTEIMQKKIDS